MGRYGCNRDYAKGELKDIFVLIIDIQGYCFMLQRIYDKKNKKEIETNMYSQSFNSVTYEEFKQESEKMSFLEVLKCIVLRNN